MKKTISKETHFCDKCGKEYAYPDRCERCGMECCYECAEKHMHKYTHAVHFSGSGDAYYCNACDTVAASNGDKKHAAYRRIASLKAESMAWSKDFTRRTEEAQEAIKPFLKH